MLDDKKLKHVFDSMMVEARADSPSNQFETLDLPEVHWRRPHTPMLYAACVCHPCATAALLS
jgi:hypothetical protein